MTVSTSAFEIGVCSWSIDREDPGSAVRVAGGELGLRVIQLGFFSRRAIDRADPELIACAAREHGVRIVGTFAGFEHEDYTSIASIAETGGLTPDDYFDDRVEMIRRVGVLSVALECPFVAIHVGTIPDDPGPPRWSVLAARTREVADRLAASGLRLLLETGREPAAVLLAFIDALGRGNVAVNYDPGNLIVYGMDDPARAVSALRGRIENVHLKDAFQSSEPGVAYGARAVLGTGDAQIARVISKLRAIGYAGPLLIESGGPQAGIDAIREAAGYLRSMLE